VPRRRSLAPVHRTSAGRRAVPGAMGTDRLPPAGGSGHRQPGHFGARSDLNQSAHRQAHSSSRTAADLQHGAAALARMGWCARWRTQSGRRRVSCGPPRDHGDRLRVRARVGRQAVLSRPERRHALRSSACGPGCRTPRRDATGGVGLSHTSNAIEAGVTLGLGSVSVRTREGHLIDPDTGIVCWSQRRPLPGLGPAAYNDDVGGGCCEPSTDGTAASDGPPLRERHPSRPEPVGAVSLRSSGTGWSWSGASTVSALQVGDGRVRWELGTDPSAGEPVRAGAALHVPGSRT
jgi:hypothetical protein